MVDHADVKRTGNRSGFKRAAPDAYPSNEPDLEPAREVGLIFFNLLAILSYKIGIAIRIYKTTNLIRSCFVHITYRMGPAIGNKEGSVSYVIHT